jgi:centromeric protein E
MVGQDDQPGIIPQAINDVFNYIRENRQEDIVYLLRVSYIEIYNETIKDLLNPELTGLKIHESRNVF